MMEARLPVAVTSSLALHGGFIAAYLYMAQANAVHQARVIGNVDLLIQDDRSRTLLTWRDDEFFGAGWHLPGGIIRYKETAAERIRACAREELGADVASDAAPLLVVETIRRQATRGHFISLLFRCRLISLPDPAKRAATDTPVAGQWRWHQRCPPDLPVVQRPYAPFF